MTKAGSLSPGSVALERSLPRPSWYHSLACVHTVPTASLQTGLVQALLTTEVEPRWGEVSVRFKLEIEFQMMEKANSWERRPNEAWGSRCPRPLSGELVPIGLMTRDTSGCRQALLGIHTYIPREGQTYVHFS